MEGFGRWDLVVWVVAAYIAIITLVRMMLHALGSSRRQQQDRSRQSQSGVTKIDQSRDAA
jgi:uncharacterized membrane protein